MLVDSVYKPKVLIAMRPNDTTNPVFGFMQRNGLVPGSGANYNFLLLPHTGLIDSTVFSKPWGSEYLRRVS
jgi:hypothetical protein